MDKRRRLYQAVKKCGRVVEFTFLNRRELARWLDQRARAAGTKFGAGAKELLLDVAGPSLMHLVAELEKLFCYTAGRELITPEDVRKVCPSRVEKTFLPSWMQWGKIAEALTGIKDLLAAKEPL